jgi:purine nucleoside phosphorylase
MKIGVSACLLGENCKYNGGNNYNKKLVDFVKDHEVIPICPEVFGGLPTPRKPAEIVDGIVKLESGLSVDKEFKKGAQKALGIILKNQVDLVILQSRSPSCGVNKVYDGTFTGKIIDGQGIFTKILKENEVPVIDVEDL